MASITTSVEGERGCGYRVPGGRYLIGGRTLETCPLLPIPLDVCPTCSAGIKFSRGWTWVDAHALLGLPKEHGTGLHNSVCILSEAPDRDFTKTGLLWVGERSYTTEAFTQEAIEMGVSRRIGYLPRGLKLGETVILLAHKKVSGLSGRYSPQTPVGDRPLPDEGPAIFTAFIPTRLEYVVKGGETEETLDKLESKGYNLVKVIRKGEENVSS